MATIVVGVDIGQKRDPTAIAVVEVERHIDLDGQFEDDHYLVRYLDRLPLGTSYPKVATRIAEIVGKLQQAHEQQRAENMATARYRRMLLDDDQLHIVLYADATGVGLPVVEMIAAEGVPFQSVYFTHGDKRIENKEGGYISLGKAWLVSRLQALLQSNRIHLPDTDEARQLAKELGVYEIRVDQNANDTYGAFKVGTHDDLVTALGLGVQGGGSGKFKPVNQEFADLAFGLR